MEFLFIFVFLMSVVGGVVWWIVVIWIARKALYNNEQALKQIFPPLEEMLINAAQGYRNLNPQQKTQIMQMLMQANTRMGQLNDLSRQRYDAKMGDLMSMASSAGIDWTPPSY